MLCERETFGREILFERAPRHLKVLLLCMRRTGARYQGWVVKTGRGSGRRERGGVNSRRGERGEENINRACGAEAACHGPLQEKD